MYTIYLSLLSNIIYIFQIIAADFIYEFFDAFGKSVFNS